VFLDLPELSGNRLAAQGDGSRAVSHSNLCIRGLNAAQFAAAASAVRTVRVEAEIIEVQVPDDWGRALEAAKTRQVEAGILLSSPLSSSLQSKSASLRWLIDSLSFSLFGPNFQKRAVSSLWAEPCRDVAKSRGYVGKILHGARQMTYRYSGREVRSRHQPEDREGARHRRAPDLAGARRRGDRIVRLTSDIGTKRTRRAGPTMSVVWGRPEVTGQWPNRREWHFSDLARCLT